VMNILAKFISCWCNIIKMFTKVNEKDPLF